MDVAEFVGGGLRTPDDVWRLIDALFAAFGRPVAPGDGYPDAEMSTAPVRLPSVVATLLRRYGRRPEFTAGQDWVLGPHQLHYDDEGVLVIRDENQYTAVWGVTDLDHPDPPVLYRREDGDWVPYLDRYSLAAADFALSETVLAGDGLVNAAEVEPAAGRRRSRRLPRRARFRSGTARRRAPSSPLRRAPGRRPCRSGRSPARRRRPAVGGGVQP